jgi:hypothetical protein
MMGGQDAGARARLVLGMWTKGASTRATVTKANELSAAGMDGPTVEFERNYEAATFVAGGGRLLDLQAEAKKDRREQKDRSLEESVSNSVRRAEMMKKRVVDTKEAEPVVAAPPPAQATLLAVPESTKP